MQLTSNNIRAAKSIHSFKSMVAPAVLLAATFTTGLLHAEIVKVPFNFTVAGKQCPAGLYRVERSAQPASEFVTLEGVATTQRFAWTLRPGNPAPNDARIILNFAQMGGEHALESVQYRNGITPKIPGAKPEAERVAVRSMAGQ